MDRRRIFRYLLELRSCLLRMMIVFSLVFVVCCYFRETCFYWIALPWLKASMTRDLIATHVIDPVWVPLQCAFYAAIFLSMPYHVLALWRFVMPALYAHERNLTGRLVLVSCLLFYLGIACAYHGLLPLMFHMLSLGTPEGVVLLPDIKLYVGLVGYLLFIFGLLFEMPLMMWLLHRYDFISLKACQRARRYMVVASLTVGMLLTPPDVISQIILAVPLYLLFELGLCLMRYDGVKYSKWIASRRNC